MSTVNSKMTAIADEIRTLSGTTEAIGLDAMATHIGKANDEVDSQVELLAQVVAALEGKASGGGIDTSDANATANDILANKSAYANGEKITGTIETFDGSYECSGESTGGGSVEAWTGIVSTGGPLSIVSPTLYYMNETLTPIILGVNGDHVHETITIAANTLLYFSTAMDFAILTNAEDITSSHDFNKYRCTVIRPTANNFIVRC